MNSAGKSSFNIDPVIPYSGQNYGPDVNGHLWWSDPSGNILSLFRQDGGFPQSSWPAGYPDVGLYYTYFQGSQDGAYSAVVPNGDYNLHLGFAADSGDTGLANIVESIDTQGVTVLSTTTLQGIIGTNYYTPRAATIPVTVTNNQFYFAVRQAVQGDSVLINNWSLILSTGTSASQRIKGPIKFNNSIKMK